MLTDFEKYAVLLFRAAGHDLVALHEAHEMMDDARTHARLMLKGANGVLTDLAAVTCMRMMQCSDEHLKDADGLQHLFQNRVVQTIYPQVRALCKKNTTHKPMPASANGMWVRL